LPPTQTTHHASMTDPRKVAQLLNDLDHLEATFPVLCAARLLPLVFVRQAELRHAMWGEIDLNAAEWRIPASKMKRRIPHIVPLSKQALEILKELQPLTDHGDGSYVFPSVRNAKNPMSGNTINVALRRLGYSKDEITGHGFRSIASTLMHEKGWESALIERQLSHAEPNQVKASYNYAEHLPKRKEMMQWWSDYLDELKLQAA
jgi:integrase